MAAYPVGVCTTSKETRCPKRGEVPLQLKTSPSVKLMAWALPSGMTRPVCSEVSCETMVPLKAITGGAIYTLLPYERSASQSNRQWEGGADMPTSKRRLSLESKGLAP